MRRIHLERVVDTISRLSMIIGLGLFLALTGCSPTSHAPAAEISETVRSSTGFVREDLRFSCGEATCAGWLYTPQGANQPPVVVMANGFSGTRDVGMPFFAETFARSGFAAFAFDYRYFGASGGSPRQLLNPWDQLDDWRAALSFVRTLNQVDSERLAIWGTSMGGGHVIVVGAEDPNVLAIIAQVPAVDSDVDSESLEISVSWFLLLILLAWADLIQSMFSDSAMLIPAFAGNGEFGMLVDEQSYQDFQPLITEEATTYQNAIAARSMTTFDDYNPANAWDNIRVPTLVLASKEDRLAPFQAVEAFSTANSNVRLETFEGGHFDIYLPPVSDWAVEREVSFLASVLKLP